MGGAITSGGNRTPSAEFNYLSDPHAAHVVFTADVPIVQLPLDATHQAITTPERLQTLLDHHENAALSFVKEILLRWNRADPERFCSDGGPLHDPLVIASLVWPELFQGYRAKVSIELISSLTLGQSVADRWHSAVDAMQTHIVDHVDVDTLFPLLWRRLAELEGSGL